MICPEHGPQARPYRKPQGGAPVCRKCQNANSRFWYRKNKAKRHAYNARVWAGKDKAAERDRRLAYYANPKKRARILERQRFAYRVKRRAIPDLREPGISRSSLFVPVTF